MWFVSVDSNLKRCVRWALTRRVPWQRDTTSLIWWWSWRSCQHVSAQYWPVTCKHNRWYSSRCYGGLCKHQPVVSLWFSFDSGGRRCSWKQSCGDPSHSGSYWRYSREHSSRLKKCGCRGTWGTGLKGKKPRPTFFHTFVISLKIVQSPSDVMSWNLKQPIILTVCVFSSVHADQWDGLWDQFSWCYRQDPYHHCPTQPAQTGPWAAL